MNGSVLKYWKGFSKGEKSFANFFIRNTDTLIFLEHAFSTPKGIKGKTFHFERVSPKLIGPIFQISVPLAARKSMILMCSYNALSNALQCQIHSIQTIFHF